MFERKRAYRESHLDYGSRRRRERGGNRDEGEWIGGVVFRLPRVDVL